MTRKKARPAKIRSLMAKTGKGARGAANILNREEHLRTMAEEAAPSVAVGFFEAISGAIRGAYADARVEFVGRDSRLEARFQEHSFSILTPRGKEPAWPAIVWNNALPLEERHRHSWECDSIDDVLTVLRWPQARASRVLASVDEIRDDWENPAKHSWVRVASNGLEALYKCEGCDAKLHVSFGETVDEIARHGFANWRAQKAGTLRGRGGPIPRSARVGFIPPQCSGPRPQASVPVPSATVDSLLAPLDQIERMQPALPKVDATLNLVERVRRLIEPRGASVPWTRDVEELLQRAAVSTSALQDVLKASPVAEAVRSLQQFTIEGSPIAKLLRDAAQTTSGLAPVLEAIRAATGGASKE